MNDSGWNGQLVQTLTDRNQWRSLTEAFCTWTHKEDQLIEIAR